MEAAAETAAETAAATGRDRRRTAVMAEVTPAAGAGAETLSCRRPKTRHSQATRRRSATQRRPPWIDQTRPQHQSGTTRGLPLGLYTLRCVSLLRVSVATATASRLIVLITTICIDSCVKKSTATLVQRPFNCYRRHDDACRAIPRARCTAPVPVAASIWALLCFTTLRRQHASTCVSAAYTSACPVSLARRIAGSFEQ